MMNPLSMTRDDLLGALGLQARRSVASYILPAIGMFGVGIVTGAGLGLLFAPRSGREIRRELGTRVSDVTNKIKQRVRKPVEGMMASDDDQDESVYGGTDYSSGLDTGLRTGLTNTST